MAPDQGSGQRDQAAGLRRLFGGRQQRHIALVSNPFVEPAELVIDRLCAALGALGLHRLVVDAADGAPAPREMALLELAACIESMAPEVSYLAARGLPIRHVDSHVRCAAFLDALARAAPQADVALVHAGTSDLARLFAAQPLRPLLQAADSPRSLTEAYAALKRLAQRPGWLSHDVLLMADPRGPRTARIGESIASCAERFLGAAVHDVAVVDPGGPAVQGAMMQLLRAQLAQDRLAGPGAPHERAVTASH